MISCSPTHTVPDQDTLSRGLQEETSFYNVVLTAPPTEVQQMDTSDSDCTSESDDMKTYMPLLPERKLTGSGSLCPTLSSVDQININSWRTRHPKNWQAQDITNWIYYVCSQMKNMDRYKIRAENFNSLKGKELCNMTLNDFMQLEPNYGQDLFQCLQSLLEPANYKAPEDCSEIFQDDSCGINCENSTMWSAGALQCDNMEVTMIKPVDLDSAIVVIGDKQFDISYTDKFEDMNIFVDSDYESGNSVCLSPGSESLSSLSPYIPDNTPAPIGCDQHNYGNTKSLGPCDGMNTSSGVTYHMKIAEHTGMEAGSRNKIRPKEGHSQRGRKPGQSTKGNHLWKFIRDVINDNRYNPDVIRWEDKNNGIFRIVNSSEIARLWGKKKNNSSMTYEKFSRAMRYCRKQGDFDPLPKDQNLPKKLCFKFNAKKWAA